MDIQLIFKQPYHHRLKTILTPTSLIIQSKRLLILKLHNYPYITIDNEKEWYTDNEEITVTANVNAFSAGPVNYSWWYSGIINIDYGHEVTINTTDFGLGSHTFKLITSDILGNSEIIYFSILVYSEISATNEPFYSASATSPSNTVEIT